MLNLNRFDFADPALELSIASLQKSNIQQSDAKAILLLRLWEQISDSDKRELYELLAPDFAKLSADHIFLNRKELNDDDIRQLFEHSHGDIFFGDRLLTLDKSVGFLNEPSFKHWFSKIVGQHQYDSFGGVQTISWRLHVLAWAAMRAKNLTDGDFVECGVFQGDMSYFIWNYCDLKSTGRKLFLYDSFEGLDSQQVMEDEYSDIGNEELERMGGDYVSFANRVYSKPGLLETVKQKFQGEQNVKIVPGFLPQTLSSAKPEKIGFLHLDLNSAKAELDTVSNLYENLVSGATIILDDYGWSNFKKQKEVMDNFFAQHSQQVLELPTGQGLIVKS